MELSSNENASPLAKAQSNGWRGAFAERRAAAGAKRQADWEARIAARGARGEPLPSLDPRTLTHSAPNSPCPSLQVFIRELDGYREMAAVFDDGKSSTRRSRGKESSSDDTAFSDDSEKSEGACSTREKQKDPAREAENWNRAVRRSKRELRWRMLGLRVDRLLTLTVRNGIASIDQAWCLLERFVRLVNWRYYRSKPDGIDYVVVPELHKSGGFHLHLGLNRFYDVTVLRTLWHRALTCRPLTRPLAGADSPGNVDIKRARGSPLSLARYLAKYLGKTFEAVRCRGRRRYACSKGIRPAVRLRRALPLAAGGEALLLRQMHEADGYRVEHCFEPDIEGMRVIWMCCRARHRRG
jgi:hypothetical protein